MEHKKHVGVYSIINDNNKILLIHKGRGPYTGLLDLPGGSIEINEKATEALIREIQEETGYTLTKHAINTFLTNYVEFTEENKTKVMDHYGAIYNVEVDLESQVKTEGDGEDSLGAEWFDIDSLDLEKLSPFVKHVVNQLKNE